MARYVALRILLVVPTIFAASLLIFLVLRVLPGDPVLVILSHAPHTVEVREALREELGLNDTLPVQFGKWLWSMVSGDFGGRSLESREPISAVIKRRFPVTLLLACYAILFSIVVSVPLGLIAAVRRNTVLDYAIRAVTLAGMSVPAVWAALLVIMLLLILFNWFPPVIYASLIESPADHFQMMIWPALILAWHYSSHLVRIARSTMLDVLGLDFVTVARSKGLRELVVIVRHALPAVLVPVITVLGIQFGTLLGGAMVVESIFGLPGIGRALVQAAVARDYPVIQSVAVLLVLCALAVNLIVDILYSIIDPRIGRISSETRQSAA